MNHVSGAIRRLRTKEWTNRGLSNGCDHSQIVTPRTRFMIRRGKMLIAQERHQRSCLLAHSATDTSRLAELLKRPIVCSCFAEFQFSLYIAVVLRLLSPSSSLPSFPHSLRFPSLSTMHLPQSVDHDHPAHLPAHLSWPTVYLILILSPPSQDQPRVIDESSYSYRRRSSCELKSTCVSVTSSFQVVKGRRSCDH